MSENKTGGAAFPHVDSGCGRFERGMTLRDYFAAKALAGMLADVECNPAPEEAAGLAYGYADAMLKAREA